VWDQNDGAQLDVIANTYTTGIGWSTSPATLADGATFAQVAMDGQGNAMAVWIISGGSPEIRARRWSGGTWGMFDALGISSSAVTALPRVVMNAAGTAVVVWRNGTDVVARRYQGGVWTPSVTLNAASGTAQNVEVAMDDAGNTVAVWEQDVAGRISIWMNVFSNGAWSTAAMVESDDTVDARTPHVAMSPTGDAVIVWERGAQNAEDVWARVLR
jgi:hypothetical protein